MKKQQDDLQRRNTASARQIRLGYMSVIAVIIFGFLASFFVVQQAAHQSERTLVEATRMLADTQKLASLREIAPTELRNFLISGDQKYLERRKEAIAQFRGLMAEMIRVELSTETKYAFLQAKELEEKLTTVADGAVELKRKRASQEEVARYLENRVSPARVALENAFNAILLSQRDDAKRADAAAIETASKVRLRVVILSLAALLLSVVIGWFFSSRQIGATQKLDDTISMLQKSEDDLEEKKVVLEQAVRARDEMVGVISHELKNPLTALQTGSMLIQRLLPQDDPKLEQVQKLVARLKPSTQRMNQLISDLLDVTRLESKALSLEARACDLFGMVQDAVKSHEAMAQDKLVELKSDIQPECRSTYCDPDRTLQILTNLVNNAIKFTNAGGTVSVLAKRMDQEVEVRVTDTGKGISKEHLPHVFDRFWQAKETAYKGTGLGLSIVKGLVEAQGGKIWVESQTGVGTTFYFTLPTAKEALLPKRLAG